MFITFSKQILSDRLLLVDKKVISVVVQINNNNNLPLKICYEIVVNIVSIKSNFLREFHLLFCS